MSTSWALQYIDRAGNRLRVWEDGEAGHFDYTPARPADGGAHHGPVPEGVVAGLWLRMRNMADTTGLHTTRTEGSGGFTVAVGEIEQHFLIGRSLTLQAFDGWVREALGLPAYSEISA